MSSQLWNKQITALAVAMAMMTHPSAGKAEVISMACEVPSSELGGKINSHTRFVESNLLPALVQPGSKPYTLSERMTAYNVPGISVAVIHNGKLDWARGWGVRDTISCKPATAETAFQAASISKAVTAMVALRLVQRGKIDLDANINQSLRSWQLPSDPQLAPSGISLRQLLSHTAGLGVHGFGGYPVGSPTPSLQQILDGSSPANNVAVRHILPAGTQWQYSGGGYVLAQMALENAAGMPFSELAQREILKPLGMKRSAYAQPPSDVILENAASGHLEGKVIAGGYHVYPELAPAGLWATAKDLARFVVDVQLSVSGDKGHRLTPAMAREMLTPVKGNWGLGPALYGQGDDLRFGHDGANEGFQSTMIAYAGQGEGIVVLTNGDQGKRLADEIVRAVATDYGWKELAIQPFVEAELSQDTLAKISGLYDGNGLSVFLDARPDGLFAQTGGPRPERLVALTSRKFRTDVNGILIEFAPNYESFTIIEGGPAITLARANVSAESSTDVPIFIRGTMNDWSTQAPLIKRSKGHYSMELLLQAGDYRFKLGSADWKTADFGTSAGETIGTTGASVRLVQHGGNIRLLVDKTAKYLFTFQLTPDGNGMLSVSPAAQPSK